MTHPLLDHWADIEACVDISLFVHGSHFLLHYLTPFKKIHQGQSTFQSRMDWIEIRYGEVSMFSILNPFQEELTLKNDWIREWLIQLVLIFDIHTTRM